MLIYAKKFDNSKINDEENFINFFTGSAFVASVEKVFQAPLDAVI